MANALQRVSKAIAGGVAASVGGSSTALILIPAGLPIPPWVYALVPAANFIMGFVLVYFAPPNAPPASPPTPLA